VSTASVRHCIISMPRAPASNHALLLCHPFFSDWVRCSRGTFRPRLTKRLMALWACLAGAGCLLVSSASSIREDDELKTDLARPHSSLSVDGCITVPIALISLCIFPGLPDGRKIWWMTHEEHALAQERVRSDGVAKSRPFSRKVGHFTFSPFTVVSI
jgi:hypothetical protein